MSAAAIKVEHARFWVSALTRIETDGGHDKETAWLWLAARLGLSASKLRRVVYGQVKTIQAHEFSALEGAYLALPAATRVRLETALDAPIRPGASGGSHDFQQEIFKLRQQMATIDAKLDSILARGRLDASRPAR